MSRILRRPMFRGGRVNSYGTGIASGLADGGRVGFRTGGSYLTLPEPITNQPIGRNARGQDVGITGISIADFFKPVTVGPTGFSDYMPGDRLRQAEREKFPMYDEFTEETESDDDGIVRLASLTDDIKIPKSKSEANVEAGLPTSEILPEEPELKKEQVVKTPTVKETEENEVTMTDLERALGLDDARKEYVGDALAAASKAFFEGRGFEAISDAAQVKSKAPEIKRLAGLEEFKAKKTKELYEAKKKDKQFAPGNFEKNDKYLKLKYPELTDRQRLKIQLKKPSSFVEQYIELSNDVGYKNDEVFKDSARLFYDNEYKKDVDVQSVISPDKSTELGDGVYSDAKNKIIFQVKDKVVISSQNY